MTAGKMNSQEGDLFLQGDYRLMTKLGEGGMGQVWAAIELYSGNLVAIKLLRDQGGNFAMRFRQECRFYTKLRHPNIVNMLKAGEDEHGAMYIIMDLLRGKTVRKVLHTSTRLELAPALHLAIQLADAGGYMHTKGVWHRDLKPENLMVGTKDELKGHLWLFDFGIAKFANTADDGLNSDELPDVATVRYMAPEQIDLTNRPRVDGRVDIYAFGVILYELLTGRHIFIRDNEPTTTAQIMVGHLTAAVKPIPELVSDCPEDVWLLVEKCLARDPDQRYQRFTDVATGLRGMIGASMPPDHYIARRVKREQLNASRVEAFADMRMDEETLHGRRATEEKAEEGAPRVERITEPMPLNFVPSGRALPFVPVAEAQMRGVGHTARMPSAATLWGPTAAPSSAKPPWSPRFGPPPDDPGRSAMLAPPPSAPPAPPSFGVQSPPISLRVPGNGAVSGYASTEPLQRTQATPPTSLPSISIMTIQPAPTPTLPIPTHAAAPVVPVIPVRRPKDHLRAVASGLMISIVSASVAVMIHARMMVPAVPPASTPATVSSSAPSSGVKPPEAPNLRPTAAAAEPAVEAATDAPHAAPTIPKAIAVPSSMAIATPRQATTAAALAGAAAPAPATLAAMPASKRAAKPPAPSFVPLFEVPSEKKKNRSSPGIFDDVTPPRSSPSPRRLY